jgi:hypothetical protein
LVTPEFQTKTAVKDNPDKRVEAAHQNEPTGADEPVTVEPVHDKQGDMNDLAHNTNPPSPT